MKESQIKTDNQRTVQKRENTQETEDKSKKSSLSAESLSNNPFFTEGQASVNPFLSPDVKSANPFTPTQKKEDTANTHTFASKMSADTESKMSDSFGVDFKQVNIHKNSDKANELNAHAFTQGTDIHFAKGEYDDKSPQGLSLLGHELTHVVQQSQGKVQPTTQMKDLHVNDDSSLEAEADQMGEKVANNVHPTIQQKTTLSPIAMPVVQGAFTHRAKDLKAKGFKPSKYSKNSSLNTLLEAIPQYDLAVVKENKPLQLKLIEIILSNAQEWVSSKHRKNTDEEKQRIAFMRDVMADAQNELENLEDEQYTEDVKANKLSTIGSTFDSEAKFNTHKMLSEDGKFGKDMQTRFDTKKASNLRQGELTAMIKFTEAGGSYKYMKPAFEGIDSWLEESLIELKKIKPTHTKKEKEAIMKTHKEEGKRHMKMAMRGVKKLPIFKGTVYRGMDISQADFDKNYQAGKTVKYSNLTSTSKDKEQAISFMDGKKGVKVLMEITSTKGRDISTVSDLPSEQEVLYMPGDSFKITHIKTEKFGTGLMKRIYMQES